MPVAAVIGASVISAGASIISGNKAAGAATQAADKSAEVQRYMFDQGRADTAPWREVGKNALDKLAKIYGVQSKPAAPAPAMGGVMGQYGGYSPYDGDDGFALNYQRNWQRGQGGVMGQALPTAQPAATEPANDDPFADFFASPDYKFRLSEGMKAIERSAAARGGLRSGATMKSIGNYAQGQASGEWNNYVNRIAALAGVGQQQANNDASAGRDYANNMSDIYTNAGNARASAYANTGNAINQGVGNIAAAYLYNRGYGTPPYAG